MFNCFIFQNQNQKKHWPQFDPIAQWSRIDHLPFSYPLLTTVILADMLNRGNLALQKKDLMVIC